MHPYFGLHFEKKKRKQETGSDYKKIAEKHHDLETL